MTMIESLDLKQIEKQAFTRQLQAGHWELCAGLILLTLGVSSLMSSSVWGDLVYGLMLIPAVTVAPLIRSKVIIPRIGQAVFGPVRRTRLGFVLAAIVAMLAIGVLVYLVLGQGDAGPAWATWIREHLMGLLGSLLILSFFSAVAHWMDHPLYYAIGLCCALGFAGRAITRSPWFLFVSAGIVLAIGLFQLIRFLKRYPPVSDQEIHEEA